MITQAALKHLTTQKLKDAEALLKTRRHCGSIYLAGYALECSLKRKISQTLNFRNGFPDQKSEFNAYATAVTTPTYTLPIAQLKEIRNHNLPKLLFYSGVELTIKTRFLEEWSAVSSWNPENRYKVNRCSHEKAVRFLKAVKTLVGELA